MPPLPRAAKLATLIWLPMVASCATLPDLPPAPAPKQIDALAGERAFAAPPAEWPSEEWWTSWGDPALDAVMAEALAGSPDMAAAAARLARAGADAEVAGAALLPSLDLNGEITKQRQSENYLTPAVMMPSPWRSYPQATANLSWELDLWGKNRAALAAASGAELAARADVAQARLLLSSSLASAWAELAHLHATRDTAAAALDVRAKTAALMRDRRDHGLETDAALRRADSRLAAARGDIAATDEQLALQRNAIAALMGAGPDRALSIPRPRIDLAAAPGLPPDLALGLLGRRPDVVAARLRIEAAEGRFDRQEAEFYPDVNLSAFIGLQSLGIETFARHGSLIGSIGPALSLPIFDGGRLRGQLKGARADRDLAVADYDSTLTRALHEVADAATSMRALDQRLDAASAANAAAEDAWKLQRQRYLGGLATALDVLTVEDEMLSSRRALDDLRSRAFAIAATLAKSLGGGWRATAG